jgi:hypothetical protein
MVKSVLVAATLALACLAGGGAARAADNYELAVIPGSSQVTEVVVRTNVTTGQSVLSAGIQSFVSVAETAPVGAGAYRIYAWNTTDNGTATRAYNVYRMDAASGRLWHLVYDGKVTASWVEITAAH